VSVEEKLNRLAKFIAENPAFSNVPFMVVAGRPITPTEALAMLRAGVNVQEIMVGLQKLGLDLPWELAEEFYRRVSAAYPEAPKIYALAEYVPAMTPTEAYEHIKGRDAVGETLVRAYAGMLEFMRLRVNG
jgi:hypothetical protein